MTLHALLFELDSIQAYLFASGRLRDVAGASELIDRLTNPLAPDNLLDAACRAVGLDLARNGQPRGSEVAFSRRAGGAFYAFSEDRQALEQLRDLWTMAVQMAAPYLGYTLGLGEGANARAAFAAARQAMRHDASRLRSPLPAGAPVTERSRRTGLPAVTRGKGADGPLDAATRQRKRFGDLAASGFLSRFGPQDSGLGWRDWPRNLEGDEDGGEGVFPFAGESRILALIHADGNGLGQILRRLDAAAERRPEHFIPLYTAFSKLVETVATGAARAATETVLLPARAAERSECLAARPVLLGGDDITLLVRADLAMDWVRSFTRAFEQESRKGLAELGQAHGVDELPGRLTLGIGMVYLRASQPFHQAVRLAEALTRVAKQAARERDRDDPASTIAFYRVTGNLIDDYDQLVEETLSHRHADKVFVDTLGAYFFDDTAPRLDDLLELARLLGREDMARGPARTLLTLMGHAPGEASARYRRWRQVMNDRQKHRLVEFDELLKRLTAGEPCDELPYTAAGGRAWHSPLGDALALLGAGHATGLPVEAAGNGMTGGDAA